MQAEMTDTTKNSLHLLCRIRLFWRKHLQDIWRDFQWPLIAILGLIALVLGYIGFGKQFEAQGVIYSSFDRFYASLQLFVLSAPLNIGTLPIELELARFLALVVAFYTVLTALIVILNEQVQFLNLKMIGDHIVICGLGQKGYHLAKKLNESGEQIVVIECDEENDMLKSCAEQGTIVLLGDAKDKELLRKAGVHKAKFVVSFCSDDSTNIQVAINSRELAADRKDKVLTCIANIMDPHVCQVLGGLEIEMEKDNSFRLDFINITDLGVRSLLEKYPPYTDVQTAPHILIVGLGEIGEKLIIQVARIWRSEHIGLDRNLRITLIDKDAESIQQTICSRYPKLEQVCEFEARKLDIKSSEFYQFKFISDSKGSSDISSVYVCYEEDYLGLSAALVLLKQLGDKIPIVVQTDYDSGVAALFNGDEFENLHVFGMLDQACDPELVLKGNREILARAIHQNYLAQVRNKSDKSVLNPSNVSWEELPEDLKNSNRHQADHIGVKLRKINCSIAPLAQMDAESFEFKQEEIEMLAEFEHERWVSERSEDGWVYGEKKDIEKKISPYLIPWDQLTDEIKEYDRSPIRKLPEFLAQSGFQIYRLI